MVMSTQRHLPRLIKTESRMFQAEVQRMPSTIPIGPNTLCRYTKYLHGNTCEPGVSVPLLSPYLCPSHLENCKEKCTHAN